MLTSSGLDLYEGLYGVQIIFTAQRCASTVYVVVVCLSVCLSVTLRYCIKMAKSILVHYLFTSKINKLL